MSGSLYYVNSSGPFHPTSFWFSIPVATLWENHVHHFIDCIPAASKLNKILNATLFLTPLSFNSAFGPSKSLCLFLNVQLLSSVYPSIWFVSCQWEKRPGEERKGSHDASIEELGSIKWVTEQLYSPSSWTTERNLSKWKICPLALTAIPSAFPLATSGKVWSIFHAKKQSQKMLWGSLFFQGIKMTGFQEIAFQYLKGTYRKAGEKCLQGHVVIGWGRLALNWKRGDLYWILERNPLQVMGHWNKFPKEIVDAPSRLNKALSNLVRWKVSLPVGWRGLVGVDVLTRWCLRLLPAETMI